MEQVLGGLLAFATAGLAIYFDCYQAIRKKMVRVPGQVLKAWGILVLAAFVGVIAVGIFLYTSQKFDKPDASLNALDTILTLKIANPYLRAAYVGLLTLAIIRSKVLDLKNAPFGLEYVYTEARLRVLMPAFAKWGTWRDQFIASQKAAAFADGSTYFDDLEGRLNDAAGLQGDNSEIGRTLAELSKHKPPLPVAAATWGLYYRTLTRFALDTLGPAAFSA